MRSVSFCLLLIVAGASESLSEVTSAAFFRTGTLQTVHLEIEPADYQRLHSALPERIYVPATFRSGEEQRTRVGVRFKGNSSSHPRSPHRRSFLIKFDEYESDQRFAGLRRVALDNGIQFGGLFSEPLITDCLRSLGIVAPRCNHCELYVNGRFLGVYVNVERIDEVFLQTHLPPGDGALYKVDEGGPGGNLAPLGPGARDRKLAFEPKSAAAHEDARDVLRLIEQLHGGPPADFPKRFEQLTDVDAFLKTMAVMLFSGAFDQLTGWNAHNYYLYQAPTTGRWHYLPWDLDVGFSDQAFGNIPVIDGWHAAWPIPGPRPHPLLERIVGSPALRERYRKHAKTILESHFHPDRLIPQLDAMHARLKPALDRDPFPPRRITNPTDRSYEDMVDSMRQFIRRRYQLARQQLANPGPPPRLQQPREPEPGPASADAPTDLSVELVSRGRVRLQWTDNATGEAGHIIQRAEDEAGTEFHNRLGRPGDHEQQAEDEVLPGRTYYYRVFAVLPTPQGPRGSGVSNIAKLTVPSAD